MNTTHVIALLLAVLGPFVLVLGLDFILGMAGRREGAGSENLVAGRD